MKIITTNRVSVLLITLFGASYMLILSGCSVFQGGTGDGFLETDRIASLARVASFVGAATQLQAHPEQRPQFEMARTAVDTLLTSDTIDPAALRDAVALLPVNELRSGNTAILATGALLLLEDFSGQRTDIKNPPEVKALAIAIRDGLGLALSATPTAPAPGG